MISLALSSTSIAALLTGSTTVYLPFIPSGSTGLITADSLVFKVVGEWVIEGSTILQSPTPPNAADYRIVGTTVEAV